jgi:hypothetical protein
MVMNDTTNDKGGGSGDKAPAAPPGLTLGNFGPDVARQSLEARKSFAEKLTKAGYKSEDVNKALAIDGSALPEVPKIDPEDQPLVDALQSFTGGLPASVVEMAASSRAEVSESEHNLANAWRIAHMNDPTWTKKYLDGDVEARKMMVGVNTILSKPVLPDAQWQTKYGKPK